ncbi:MAG: hypothetical protein GY870_12710 [archaeon]|nr:hypothetical protein [archaeon]
MKTIQISDEDYEKLMEFSKELQLQENHSQAFPYFWEPASEKLVIDANNEGEIVKIFDPNECDSFEPDDYAINDADLYNKFIEKEGYEIEKNEYKDYVYESDIEYEWIEFLKKERPFLRFYSENWEQKTEHNPSLFLSDVKNYIESNTHHLGRNPRTYARTVWRMPKMQTLIEIIYRLNPQQKVNPEAARFVNKK